MCSPSATASSISARSAFSRTAMPCVSGEREDALGDRAAAARDDARCACPRRARSASATATGGGRWEARRQGDGLSIRAASAAIFVPLSLTFGFDGRSVSRVAGICRDLYAVLKASSPEDSLDPAGRITQDAWISMRIPLFEALVKAHGVARRAPDRAGRERRQCRHARLCRARSASRPISTACSSDAEAVLARHDAARPHRDRSAT